MEDTKANPLQQHHLRSPYEPDHHKQQEIIRKAMTNSTHPPEDLLCPVTSQLLVDPVLVRATCNHTVSRECFMDWLREGNQTCPLCQAPLKALYAKTNQETKKKVQSFLLEHQSSASSSPADDINSTQADNNVNNKITKKNKAARRDALKVKPGFQLEIQLEAYSYARNVAEEECNECSHRRHHLHQYPESPRPVMAEKETSHSTLETMEMSNHSAQTSCSCCDCLDDNDDNSYDRIVMDDWSGRVRRRDSPDNWEDSCASISNIRTRTSAAIANNSGSNHHQSTNTRSSAAIPTTNLSPIRSGGKPCILSYKVARSPIVSSGGGSSGVRHSPTRSPNQQQERNRPIQRLLSVMSPSPRTKKSPPTNAKGTRGTGGAGNHNQNQMVAKKKSRAPTTATATGKTSILMQQLRLPFGAGP